MQNRKKAFGKHTPLEYTFQLLFEEYSDTIRRILTRNKIRLIYSKTITYKIKEKVNEIRNIRTLWTINNRK
jgi:hypothetical protein